MNGNKAVVESDGVSIRQADIRGLRCLRWRQYDVLLALPKMFSIDTRSESAAVSVPGGKPRLRKSAAVTICVLLSYPASPYGKYLVSLGKRRAKASLSTCSSFDRFKSDPGHSWHLKREMNKDGRSEAVRR